MKYEDYAREFFISHGDVRPATVRECADWFEIYLDKGGRVLACVAWDDEFYVATCDTEPPPCYGRNGLNILVPQGIALDTSRMADNAFYYFDGAYGSRRPQPLLTKAVAAELKQRGYAIEHLLGLPDVPEVKPAPPTPAISRNVPALPRLFPKHPKI